MTLFLPQYRIRTFPSTTTAVTATRQSQVVALKESALTLAWPNLLLCRFQGCCCRLAVAADRVRKWAAKKRPTEKALSQSTQLAGCR